MEFFKKTLKSARGGVFFVRQYLYSQRPISLRSLYTPIIGELIDSVTIVDTEKPHTVTKENIRYKCKWSPFEGTIFSSSVTATFVNGKLAYNDNKINPKVRGMRLQFDR